MNVRITKDQRFLFQFVNSSNGTRTKAFSSKVGSLVEELQLMMEEEKEREVLTPISDSYVLIIAALDDDHEPIVPTGSESPFVTIPLFTAKTFVENFGEKDNEPS